MLGVVFAGELFARESVCNSFSMCSLTALVVVTYKTRAGRNSGLMFLRGKSSYLDDSTAVQRVLIVPYNGTIKAICLFCFKGPSGPFLGLKYPAEMIHEYRVPPIFIYSRSA